MTDERRRRRSARNLPWMRNGLGPRDFVRKYGRSAYDRIPRSGFIRDGHRKFVRQEYIEDFMQ